MKYPLPETSIVFFSIPTLFGEKTFSVNIPEATLEEIIIARNLSEEQLYFWIFEKLCSWGLPSKIAKKIIQTQKEKVLEILEKTFFVQKNTEIISASVLSLAENKKYNYTTPEDIVFLLLAKYYRITPKQTLKYTISEIRFLTDIVAFANLNEEQEAELVRLENLRNFRENKAEMDALFAELEV